MTQTRVNLRDPWMAAGLAWLFPGLGHLYQRRWFKAALFCLCVNFTYFGGSILGDGKVVYWNWDLSRGNRTYGFFAQALIGGPTLPAVLQARRAAAQHPTSDRSKVALSQPIRSRFRGKLQDVRLQAVPQTLTLLVEGDIELQPSEDPQLAKTINGTFTGTGAIVDEQGAVAPATPIEFRISYLMELEPDVFPSAHRDLSCDANGQIQGPQGGSFTGNLHGKCLNVRGLLNRFDAPLDPAGLQLVHGDLGKIYDIACVYTWIAGLLNLLVIWDALQGPAYGYGDENESPAQATGKAPAAGAAPPEPGTTTPAS